MTTRILPVAAVQKGDTVRWADGPAMEPASFTVASIAYSTPTSGTVQWTDTEGRVWTAEAAVRVEVLALGGAR